MSVVKLPLTAAAKPKFGCVYRMARKSDAAEIMLYGVVGDSMFSDGITAKQFSTDLKALGKVSAIDLRINSEGGDVFQGRTIFNLLNEHPARVTAHVDGLAASIASLIAMAADEIKMGDGAFMMVHQPWSFSVGNAAEMRRTADLLDSVSGTMIDTYAQRTGQPRDAVKAMLDAETWMTAEEAKKYGFADTISEPVRLAASVRCVEAFKNLPSSLRPNRALAQTMLDRGKAAGAKS